MLQESLKSGQAVDRHRKRRMQKVYQRFCQRFEASIIDSTSAPPTKSSSPIGNRNSLSPDVIGRTQRPSHHRQQSTQSVQSSLSTQHISRKDSQASRQPIISRVKSLVPERRDSRNVDECTIPGCTKCGPDAIEPRPRQSRRQSMLQQPSEYGSGFSYHYLYDTRSQASDPAPYYPQSPPTNTQQFRPYHIQGGVVVQPAISRPMTTNARPIGYHGVTRDSRRQ